MSRTPKYQKRANGQAAVWLEGKYHYLGKYGSEESKAEYRRLIAEWKAQGGHLLKVGPRGLSVNEVLLAFVKAHAHYYRRKDGSQTGELDLIRYAARIVKELYGHRSATEFGPLALKACRHEMIEKGWARKTINNQVARIKRVFRWATENELVPPNIYQALRAVAGLRKGRSLAKETEPVRPVPEEHVEVVLELVAEPVAAVIRLQLLTGMRSGEALAMRARNLDRSGELWVYVPESHKTEHHGHERTVYLGPEAQAAMRPFLKADPDAYLFCPKDAEETRSVRRRGQRKSAMTPSQAKRRRARNRRRAPGDRYTVRSYRRCIARACRQANVPHWHPHQLRHNAGTNIRKAYDVEAARAVLGTRSLKVTEIYAEEDRSLAARIMAAVG